MWDQKEACPQKEDLPLHLKKPYLEYCAALNKLTQS